MLAEQRQNYTASELEQFRAKERKKELKIVAQNKQQRALKVILLSGLFLIFALCFLYVAVEAKIYNTGYAILAVREEISTVQGEAERVSLEVDYLSSMERIEPLAMAMGMVYPETDDKVFVAGLPSQDNAVVQASVEEEPQVEIEVLNTDSDLSFGDKLLQVLGSLFGGHFNVDRE